MPSIQTVRRQRALGGALGVLVLGAALVYHFFPRVFHVDPSAMAPRRAAPTGFANTPVSSAGRAPVDAEAEAGPPLTLAPAAVIAARTSLGNQRLPEQLSADTPQVQALLARADQALAAGRLAGAADSAAALYAQALRDKPDSRAAAKGLNQVRAQLVAQIGQDIAVGDGDSAKERLDDLRGLPDSADDVAQLEQNLDTLTKVRPMLAQAASLLRQGKADRPQGASALDLYRRVQALDPGNAVAEQGVFQVQRVVLDRALAAVAQNDFAAADRALAEADTLRPGSQQLTDVRDRVQGIRQQRASGLLAQARSALDAGNLDLAQRLAGQAQALQPGLQGIDDFEQQMVNARLYASYKPGQAFSDSFVDRPGHAPPMVVIPTGSFQMGAPETESDRDDAETPRHEVSIAKGFAMARSAITVDQFRDFVRTSGYIPDSQRLGGASVYDERSGALRDDPRANWQDDYAGRPAGNNLPVVNVSWRDANAYADWLSQRTGKHYRLPSEAEFEYALRGGTQTRYWWGEHAPTRKVENLTGSGDRSPSGRRWSHAFAGYRDGYWGPAPVMSFVSNPFHLFDMGGNVSQWVADCWHDNYVRAPVDGGAWLNPGCTVRVVRGGSWGSSPEQVRSAYRQGADGSVRSARVGFRVVRVL